MPPQSWSCEQEHPDEADLKRQNWIQHFSPVMLLFIDIQTTGRRQSRAAWQRPGT